MIANMMYGQLIVHLLFCNFENIYVECYQEKLFFIWSLIEFCVLIKIFMCRYRCYDLGNNEVFVSLNFRAISPIHQNFQPEFQPEFNCP